MVVRRGESLDTQRGVYPFLGVCRPFDPEETFIKARLLSPLIFGLLRFLIGSYSIVVVIVDIVLTGTQLPYPSFF